MTDTKETAYCQEGKSLATCPVHRNPSLSESEEAISMEIHEILSEKINAMGEVGESDRCRRRYVKTCPYYVSEPSYRRFTGKLEDVKGEKIRRQDAFILQFMIYVLGIGAATVGLFVQERGIPLHRGWMDNNYFMQSLLAWVILSGTVYLISLCNRHWYGRLVGIIGEDAFYINTRKIIWKEIKKITYVEKIPSTMRVDHPIQLSYINIECKDDQEYRIYHPSKYFLNKIRHYAPQAEVCTKSIKYNRIFMAVLPVILFLTLLILT